MSTPDAVIHSASASYAFDNTRAEHHRLRLQAEVLRAHDVALLDGIELEPGSAAVDLGCGPGGSLDLLSERVGADGRVIGVEIDTVSVDAARAFVKQQRLANVQIVKGDARHTGLAGSSFDLVHTRLLLVNIPAPEQVVFEMARLASPGGWIVVLEPDIGLRVCQPCHPSVERLAVLLATAYRRGGADPHLGRRLPHLLASAGLVQIGLESRAEVCSPGHAQRSVIADLVQNMRTKILEHRLIDERALAELDRTAREHLDDPKTMSIPVTYFLAWARKPARPA